MALKYLDGGRITGLSTDAKPDRDTSDTTSPALTVQAGSVFIETDTGSKYVHNGTAWIQQTFDSINSALGKSGGVTKRQWFQEWFTGKSLNTDIWNITSGSGETPDKNQMNDSIDGGYYLAAQANAGAFSQLDFNGNKQFGGSCTMISVQKLSGGSNIYARFGFASSQVSNPPDEVGLKYIYSNTYIQLQTNGTGFTQVNTDTGFSMASYAEQWVVGKTDVNASNVTETINGVLTATQAVSMGSVAMQPRAFCNAQASNSDRGFVIRYMECYNK